MPRPKGLQLKGSCITGIIFTMLGEEGTDKRRVILCQNSSGMHHMVFAKRILQEATTPEYLRNREVPNVFVDHVGPIAVGAVRERRRDELPPGALKMVNDCHLGTAGAAQIYSSVHGVSSLQVFEGLLGKGKSQERLLRPRDDQPAVLQLCVDATRRVRVKPVEV